MPAASRATSIELRRLLLIGGALLLVGCQGDNPLEPDPEPEPEAPASLPVFTVTSPAPGAMLTSGSTADEIITVTGQACDPLYAITSLTVGGTAVTVSGTDKCVPFSVPHPSRWGMTIVTGVATNAKGQTGHLAHSFIRSSAYLAVSAPGAAATAVDSAVIAVLDAQLLDNGDPADTDDLAGLFRYALSTMPINSFIPSVITGAVPPAPDCPSLPNIGYRVSKGGNFTVSSWSVSQVAVGDTLKVTVRLNNPSVPATVNGYSNGCVTGLVTTTTTGTISATSVTAVLPFVPAVVEGVGSWALVPSRITTGSSGIAVNVDLGALAFLGSIVDGIASAAANGFATVLHNQLKGQVAEWLAAHLLETSATFQFNENGTVTLPFSAVGLDTEEATQAMRLISGDLKFSKKVGIKPIEHRPGPGAPNGPVKYPKQPLQPKQPGTEILIAIHWDLLNQYFWSAWDGGAFDLMTFDVPGCGTLPVGLQVSSHAMLPPVVMPNADSISMDLGIGGINLIGQVDPAVLGRSCAPVPFTLTVAAIVGVDFVLDATAKKISGVPKPGAQVAIQVGSVGGAELAGPIRDAVGPYLACVARELTLKSLSSFPIPTIKIGKLPSSGLPAEKAWLPQDGSGAVKAGWLIYENQKQ
jgi:hypothetical protein